MCEKMPIKKRVICWLSILLIPQLGCAPANLGTLGSGGEEPSNEIIYKEETKELHIYGKKDADNRATVAIDSGGTPAQALDDLIVVTLETEGFALKTESFKLYDSAWEAASVPVASPPRAIEEIWYHGSSKIDIFNNQTDIPSIAFGQAGNDELNGGSSVDHLYGHTGNDVLRGNAGDDKLYGGHGSDSLFGGTGNDYLKVTATGNDADMKLLCGGSGADELVGSGLADNQLDGGTGDEPDILRGFASAGHSTKYEFTLNIDIIYENGVLLDPADPFYPTSNFIDCTD